MAQQFFIGQRIAFWPQSDLDLYFLALKYPGLHADKYLFDLVAQTLYHFYFEICAWQKPRATEIWTGVNQYAPILTQKQEGPQGPRSLTWGKGQVSRWSHYIIETKHWYRTSTWCYIPNLKALGLVVSDNIFENCNLKTYFLTPWPTYPTNQNHFNNFGRGPPRDHSCWVWSHSLPLAVQEKMSFELFLI